MGALDFRARRTYGALGLGGPLHVAASGRVPGEAAIGRRLLWSEEWGGPLALGSSTAPLAKWGAVDMNWQDPDRGFRDFAGPGSYDAVPGELPGWSPHIIGPVKGATGNGRAVTIRVVRTRPEWASIIAASMAAGQQSGPVPPWVGGYLATNPKAPGQRWASGYFAWRVKLENLGPGMFPAPAWLYATDGQTDPQGKGAAELDAAEVFGVPGIVNGTAHARTVNPTTGVQAEVRPPIDVYQAAVDLTEWHVFGIDYQPAAGYVQYYLDGAPMGAPIVGADAAWYAGVTMGPRLNYAMDASWFTTKSGPTTPAELRLHCDWVRVWDSSGFPAPAVPPPVTGPVVVDDFTGTNGAAWTASTWTTAASAGGSLTQQAGAGRVVVGTAGNYADKAQAQTLSTFTGGEYLYDVAIGSKAEYTIALMAHASGGVVDWTHMPATGYWLSYVPVTNAAAYIRNDGYTQTQLAAAAYATVVGDVLHVAIRPGVGVWLWKNGETRPTAPTLASTNAGLTSGRAGVGVQGGAAAGAALAARTVDVQRVTFDPLT